MLGLQNTTYTNPKVEELKARWDDSTIFGAVHVRAGHPLGDDFSFMVR